MSSEKLVVFDLDGTLVDTRAFVVDALNTLSEEYGFDYLEEEDVYRLRSTHSVDFLKVLGVSIWKGPFLIRRVQKMLAEKMCAMELVPEMGELLLDLKDRGYTLGVITSNSEKNMSLFFEKYEGKYFDVKQADVFVFGKARALKKMAKKHNFPLQDTFYVGDETRDIRAAKSAGVHVVAVSWGFNTEEILETLDPRCVAEKPDEILHCIEKNV